MLEPQDIQTLGTLLDERLEKALERNNKDVVKEVGGLIELSAKRTVVEVGEVIEQNIMPAMDEQFKGVHSRLDATNARIDRFGAVAVDALEKVSEMQETLREVRETTEKTYDIVDGLAKLYAKLDDEHASTSRRMDQFDERLKRLELARA